MQGQLVPELLGIISRHTNSINENVKAKEEEIITKIFQLADYNKDGAISREEFIELVASN